MPSPELKVGQNLFDVAIIGNGTAAAGAVSRFASFLKDGSPRPLSVVVLESITEQQREACIPEYNARVTFPSDLPFDGVSLEEVLISWYDKVAYYTHKISLRKELPPRRVALVDVYRLIDAMERELPPQIQLRLHKQVFDANYIKTAAGELIELWIQYPFGPEKVFEVTDKLYARTVIDCAGTGSLLLDKMQGYRNDSAIVCGVLAFKVIGAKLADPGEVSLGLDDSITHGAGSWSYPNRGISEPMAAYLEEWFRTTKNRRIQQMIRGKRVEDFVGTLSDVGISSISPYANVQHYQRNLERQAEDLFQSLPGYREMFLGAAVIPGSAFFKPSPVLQPVSRMAGRRYLLAGDAAGHATPYIGEGVRPGMDMGYAAAQVLLDAFEANDFSESYLRARFEKIWWDRYGHYDLWSELFRHFSSTCFSDKEWTSFFGRLKTLTAEEFYRVLRSEYDLAIVAKMFPYELLPRYAEYQGHRLLDFLRNRLTLRQVSSWLR